MLEHYVDPALKRGGDEIVIRAGDLHREMLLSNAMPNVCSAIGSLKFTELAGLTLVERSGPHAGSNARFVFRRSSECDNPHPLATSSPSRPVRVLPDRGATRPNIDFSDALVLVSCVKSKQSHACAARNLYMSEWFKKVRALIEAQKPRWLILSALYGLVEPDAVIEPYECTLNTLGVADRRAWATRLLPQLVEAAQGFDRVVLFAGERYREFISPELERQGRRVEIPMAGLTIGRQLAWLSNEK